MKLFLARAQMVDEDLIRDANTGIGQAAYYAATNEWLAGRRRFYHP
jgi:hypothetical protein